MKYYKHTTVLLNEAVNSLNIHQDGIYIDTTFGYGGHSRLILSQLGNKGRLLAIDRDPYAIFNAKDIVDPRFSIIHGLFSKLSDYVKERQLTGKINGILFDLGLSYMQIRNAERGFSFMYDGPLDMRMDPTKGQSASEWLKITKENDISLVLKNFGEERFSKRIAHEITKCNQKKLITRTKELVEVITKTIPKKDKFKHPATRTFQAIRIQVNNELEEIKLALKSSLEILAPGGRISIISFHSLEDRIVKFFIREHSQRQQVLGKLPITEKKLKKLKKNQLRDLGKFIPSKEEILKNRCSRSAILRIAEKINE